MINYQVGPLAFGQPKAERTTIAKAEKELYEVVLPILNQTLSSKPFLATQSELSAVDLAYYNEIIIIFKLFDKNELLTKQLVSI